jgi:hypothetical protein
MVDDGQTPGLWRRPRNVIHSVGPADTNFAQNADSALGWCGDGRSARAAQIAALWLACCRGCRWHDGQHDRPDALCGGGLPGPAAVAGFYSALLGLPVIYRDDDWLVVAASDISSGLAFQRAPGNLPRTWPDAVQCSAAAASPGHHGGRCRSRGSAGADAGCGEARWRERLCRSGGPPVRDGRRTTSLRHCHEPGRCGAGTERGSRQRARTT